jgi:type IV pilus assembly protein PilN
MIKINLFPFREAIRKENVRRQVTVYILSIVFLLLASAYGYLHYNNKVKELREERDVKQKELDSFKDINAKIAAIQKTIAEVDLQLKTIKMLEEGKTGPVKLLDDIASSVLKDKLWLTTLKEERGALTLNGTAMDNETVADFMDRLEDTESINSVELVKTTQKKIPEFDLSLKDFSLQSKTYAFKEPVPPKNVKKK